MSVERLRDALSDPSAYPHAPDRVELIQTHISLVAIVPPRVYKIKKPVDLGFLDFTTLERRKHFCEREVALNRRLCGGVYEAVVPVVDTAEGLRVDPADEEPSAPTGSEDPVDWAVRMRYMEPSQFLDRRLREGRLPEDAIDRVVETLCAFYREQPSTPEIAAEGWIDRIRVSTQENFEQTEAVVGHALSRPAFEALQDYVDHFFDSHAALFHRRRAGGFIREGHGDLRLEHIHLTDDRVCIYDCIEFNERFRRIDIANDIAFLAMDLDDHERPDLAQELVDGVADRLDDPDLHRLVTFYKSYRAYVRAKVHSMRAAEGEVPPAERTKSRARARRHYQWALRYAVADSEPLVVIVMGRSGTGKTTQAAALADSLGWAHLSSDRIRKTRAGVPLHHRPDADTRQWLYGEEMSRRTYATMRQRALERARRERSTVLDATYSRRAERDALREALHEAEVNYVFVELTASDDALKERLDARESGAPTVSDARSEDFELLSSRYDAPHAREDARHLQVPSAGSPAETATDLLRRLIRLRLSTLSIGPPRPR